MCLFNHSDDQIQESGSPTFFHLNEQIWCGAVGSAWERKVTYYFGLKKYGQMLFSRYFNKYLISKFHPIEVLTYWKSSLSRCGSAAFHLKHCIAPMNDYQAKSNKTSTSWLSFTPLLNIKLSIRSIWQPGVWTVPATKCCLKVTRRQCRHLCWYCNDGTMSSVNPSTRNVLFHIIRAIVCDGKLTHCIE